MQHGVHPMRIGWLCGTTMHEGWWMRADHHMHKGPTTSTEGTGDSTSTAPLPGSPRARLQVDGGPPKQGLCIPTHPYPRKDGWWVEHGR
jgi:hypothetical protein